jgi:hypothetical protein
MAKQIDLKSMFVHSLLLLLLLLLLATGAALCRWRPTSCCLPL